MEQYCHITVVANESYDAFAKALQTEIEEDTGVNFSGRVKNARNKETIRIKDKWLEDSLFQDLWERIKHKTVYRVEYTAEDLIKQATHEVKEMPEVVQPQIVRTLADVTIDNSGVGTQVRSDTRKYVKNQRYPIPDFVGFIQNKTELTRDTIIRIINGSGRLTDVFINPQIFMEQVAKAINYAFDQIKISQIKYEKIANQFYEMQMFEVDEIERYLDNLVPVTQQAKTLYDHVEIDSPTERNFVQACEDRDDILFYVKLPSKFKALD